MNHCKSILHGFLSSIYHFPSLILILVAIKISFIKLNWIISLPRLKPSTDDSHYINNKIESLSYGLFPTTCFCYGSLWYHWPFFPPLSLSLSGNYVPLQRHCTCYTFLENSSSRSSHSMLPHSGCR